jgi:hypothetical protein
MNTIQQLDYTTVIQIEKIITLIEGIDKAFALLPHSEDSN